MARAGVERLLEESEDEVDSIPADDAFAVVEGVVEDAEVELEVVEDRVASGEGMGPAGVSISVAGGALDASEVGSIR